MRQSAAELDHAGHLALAAALGDAPETVGTVHKLRLGLARAFVLGAPARPRAAVIQPRYRPTEPIAFGNDAAALWDVLRDVEGWEAVNVPLDVGPALAELIRRETGITPWLCEEIYYIPKGPLPKPANAAVRRLTAADEPLMEAATDALGMAGWRFGSAAALIAQGFAAGAITGGRLVSVAFTSARTKRHAEIGIVTHRNWRGRGLATAAAAHICADVVADGQIPVWSTAIDNDASRRIAAKLGFREVSRRVYVNLIRTYSACPILRLLP